MHIEQLHGSSYRYASVSEALRTGAALHPEIFSLCAVDGRWLTRLQLWTQVCEIAESLRTIGIRATNRVAVVLPGGPELAVTFLGVASAAGCAPLNPAYRRADFDFYLDDLRPSALILAENDDSPAGDAARDRGIPILRIVPTDSGRFCRIESSEGPIVPGEREVDWSGPEEVALILHTSGTTSRPKMVPLTQKNICASAANIAATLRLTREDRCLNVMPLFHIHGLIGGLLSSIAAGAGVICAPGFDAGRFLSWARLCEATWYTAVPTMHQSILEQAEKDPESARQAQFRLARSSSASLPPSVLERLENLWGAPVIEAYGMTEAAHQMTSNPLPPALRKPGSVGIPAGPEVAIMDAEGHFQPQGEPGEVVIRGDDVMYGYEANPGANAKAFTHGWFRTGDEGYFDEDGYLFLTGRLKELINRGGEKIAPREIDEALLRHEAVAQAVAFAVPHATLGEDVAAAVVLRPGFATSELELRRFVAQDLVDFKVPGRIVFVDVIPKGPTGKLQRIGLHEKLHDLLETAFTEPQTREERWVADAFYEVLGEEKVGRDDNFFGLGGDSLSAVRVIARLRPLIGLDLPIVKVFEYPTPALLGAEIARMLDAEPVLDALAAQLATLPPDELERLMAGNPEQSYE